MRVIVAAVLISGMPDDPQLVGGNDRFSPAKMNNQPTVQQQPHLVSTGVEMGVRADGAPGRN